MGLFSKITDVVKSNINDMIDKAEDPAKMVKLMIIEMEEAATKATSSVAEAMANEKNLERKEDQAKKSALDWQNKAGQALKAGREDLAKEALAKKVNFDNQANQYEQMRMQSEKTTIQLRQQLDAIKQRLEEARMRESTIVARSESAKAQKQFAKTMGNMDTSAFSKFDKMEEKVLKQEAEADALAELSGSSLKEDEFAKLDKDSKVDDELAKLKQQLNQ